MPDWVYQWLWCCVLIAPPVLLLMALERAIHKYNLGYIMDTEPVEWAVYPDGSKYLLCEVAESEELQGIGTPIIVYMSERKVMSKTYAELLDMLDGSEGIVV